MPDSNELECHRLRSRVIFFHHPLLVLSPVQMYVLFQFFNARLSSQSGLIPFLLTWEMCLRNEQRLPQHRKKEK